MEPSEFDFIVSELTIKLDAENQPITVQGITDTLDQQNHYDKKTYRTIYSRVYQSLKLLQDYTWNLWHNYIQTEDYKKAVTLKEYYREKQVENAWKDEFFKTLYDDGMFTAEQIEASIMESLVFKDFMKDLNDKGLILTISGRGNSNYVVPNLYDFFIYKFDNMASTSRILQNQIKDFTDDGLMLPHGVGIPALQDLSEKAFNTLEYKKGEKPR